MMDAMPIARMTVSSSLSARSANPAGSGGEDFSLALRQSMDALAEREGGAAEAEPAALSESGQAAKPDKSRSAKAKPAGADEAESPVGGEAVAGQNMPPLGSLLPVNIAVVPAVAEAGVQGEGVSAGAVSASAQQGVQSLPGALQGQVFARTPQEAAALLAAGSPAPTLLADNAPQGTAPMLLANIAGAPAGAMSEQQKATAGVGAEGAQAAQAAQAAEAAAKVADATTGAAGASAMPAVELPAAAQSESVLKAADVAVAAEAQPERLPDQSAEMDIGALRLDRALQSSSLRIESSASPAAGAMAWSAALSGDAPVVNVAADAVVTPAAAMPGDADLPTEGDDMPDRAAADVAAPPALSSLDGPLAGFALVPGSPVGSAAPLAAAPAAASATVVVPAARVNDELIGLAKGGGGRAVMEITSPDLGSLKIDLQLDGQGSARRVVEASSHDARDQLEQGLRRLHDEFGGLGLKLDVDLRQGGGGQDRQDARAAAFDRMPTGAGALSNREPRSFARLAADGDAQSGIHFYA